MSPSDNTSLTPREAEDAATKRLFAFYRVRAGEATRFYPGAGARLRFASKDADTLTLPALPLGLLAAGDKVRVEFEGETVFLGDVDAFATSYGRGGAAAADVSCVGPWGKLSRLVYRQYWQTGPLPADVSLSSRLVLNMDRLGNPQSLDDALKEIAGDLGVETACGYTLAESIETHLHNQYLPYDECRDITVADAIRRELRFFPKVVVYFDYSRATPTLCFYTPQTAENSAWVGDADILSSRFETTAHPVTGVDLEIETTSEVDGVTYRAINHQRSGNTLAGNPDCLYATLRVSGGSATTVRSSVKVVTEDLVDAETAQNKWEDKTWWLEKHPRLTGVSANNLTISDTARSGSADAANYPRIAKNSAGELEAAGIRCRVEQFECKAKIVDADNSEEEIFLRMDFLTTNARPGKHWWVAEASATGGETVPAGLAAAILADRSGALRSERLSVRLDGFFPAIGDVAGGLALQDFEVDCASLVAECHFGTPDYLSPEDMAALLSGFRSKRRATCAFSRATGLSHDPDDADAAVELGGIQPLTSSEWAPGKKTKMTIFAAAGAHTGKVVVDAAAVPQGKIASLKTLTLVGAGSGGGDLAVKVLATEDMRIDPSGGGSETVEVVTDVSWNATTHKIVIDKKKLTVRAVANRDTTPVPIETISHALLHSSS